MQQHTENVFYHLKATTKPLPGNSKLLPMNANRQNGLRTPENKNEILNNPIYGIMNVRKCAAFYLRASCCSSESPVQTLTHGRDLLEDVVDRQALLP